MRETIGAWDAKAVRLTDEQATDLASRNVVGVTPQGEGSWLVRADSRVGVLVGDGWELRVRPRLAVPRLMFLLAYAADQTGWKNVPADFDEASDEVVALASAFSWFGNVALERGPLRGYQRRDEQLDTIRGRLRFADQIAHGAGLPLPVEVTYHDFTPDVLENRMLKTAASLFLRMRRLPRPARLRLLHLRAALTGVNELSDWRGQRRPTSTRLNAHYEPALKLAEVLFRSLSISQSDGDVPATTFVFDMNKVFEDFVSAAFAQSMRRFGGSVRPQDKEHSLDVGGRLKLKPDIAWWAGGRCLAVLDAKYKAIDDGKLRHEDAYQMLAYCGAYGLDRGYLVYAKDSGTEPTTHTVRNLGTRIEVFPLDVELQPDRLLKQVDELAGRVAASAMPVSVAA
jgi:5-methylcytosine-specific restriction enzyme subunit McrC